MVGRTRAKEDAAQRAQPEGKETSRWRYRFEEPMCDRAGAVWVLKRLRLISNARPPALAMADKALEGKIEETGAVGLDRT
jgi:hypothetical protein